MSKRMQTKYVAQIALMAVLMVVCAWIAVPAPVPFTLQAFGVWFAFLFLGAKRGSVAVIVYLLLGFLGLPVFAGGMSGVGALLGTHGGYMIGWLLGGLVMWLFEAVFGDRLWAKVTAMLAGLLACYTAGTAWFVMVYTRETGHIGLWSALLLCVIPFVLPDLVKLVLALWLSRKLKKVRRLDT